MNEFLSQHIIDIILAVIFIGMTVRYYIRGFAKTVLKTLAFFLSIVIAKSFSGTVTEWIFANTKLFAGMEKYIATLIITVICFVAISVLFNFLIMLVNKIFKVPVLKQANKILGGVLGALCGAILVIVICFGLQFTSHILYNTDYADAVKESAIVQTVLSEDKISEGIKALR